MEQDAVRTQYIAIGWGAKDIDYKLVVNLETHVDQICCATEQWRAWLRLVVGLILQYAFTETMSGGHF